MGYSILAWRKARRLGAAVLAGAIFAALLLAGKGKDGPDNTDKTDDSGDIDDPDGDPDDTDDPDGGNAGEKGGPDDTDKSDGQSNGGKDGKNSLNPNARPRKRHKNSNDKGPFPPGPLAPA